MKLQSHRSFLLTHITRGLSLLAACLSASLASAGPESSTHPQLSTKFQPAPDDGSSLWEVRIGIPAWAPTITGDFGLRGVNSSVDLNSLDALSSLDGLFVLSVYVRYQRWEVFGDGFYLDKTDSVTVSNLLSTTAALSMQTGFAQAFLGYRVVNSPKGYLSLFAGARYNYMGGDLQIFDNGNPQFPILRLALGIPNNLQVSGSRSWVDPVVGLKGKVHVWKPVSALGKRRRRRLRPQFRDGLRDKRRRRIPNHALYLAPNRVVLPEERLQLRQFQQ